MSSELMRYATGEVKPRFNNRHLVSQAKQVRDEVQLAGLKAEGALALGAHMMAGAVELNNHKKALAQDDPAVDLMLTEIQVTAIRQLGKIQRGLFDTWGL